MTSREVHTAKQLLSVNRQITAAIVTEAAPALIQLTPKEQRRQLPTVRISMWQRASGGFTIYPVPIEGGSHDMTSYEDTRVTAITARTDIRPGATPVTVKRHHSIVVGYDKLGDFPLPPQRAYFPEIGMTDEGDVSYRGVSVYPSRDVRGDLFHMQKAGVQVQGLAEAAIDMIEETTGIQVAAAADLSEHAREWRRQFPDLDKGPYMQSLSFMPIRVYASG